MARRRSHGQSQGFLPLRRYLRRRDSGRKEERTGEDNVCQRGVYEGAWENDAYSGTGKYTFRDSRSYDGQWREGLLDGEAVYRDAEGNVFVGTWEAGNCVKLEAAEPGEG